MPEAMVMRVIYILGNDHKLERADDINTANRSNRYASRKKDKKSAEKETTSQRVG